MTAVLTAPLARSATPTTSGTWLDVVMRCLHHMTLSPSERERLELAQAAAARIGRPLLASTSKADLCDRLDRAVSTPDILRFSVALLRVTTIDAIAIAAASPGTDLDPEMVRLLGATPARILAETGPQVAATASVTMQLIAEGGWDALTLSEAETEDWPRGFLADPGIHSTIKRAVLDGLESTAALLALSHVVLTEATISPWLALALAERFRDGLKEYLRFLAGLPFHISESVVPLRERLDLNALARELAVSEAAFERLADTAALLPGRVLSLGDDPDDP